MKIDKFNSVVEDLTKDRKGVAEGKREDYTKGDEDVLKNFKNQAKELGITPEVSLAVHMEKQFSAVLNYIKTEGESESEPIIKRIGDTINYLELLWGLINEEEESVDGNKTLAGYTVGQDKFYIADNPILDAMQSKTVVLQHPIWLSFPDGERVQIARDMPLVPFYE